MFEAVLINGLSFAYAAPERIQAFRNKSSITQEEIIKPWDVYSIGIIIFEIANVVETVY